MAATAMQDLSKNREKQTNIAAQAAPESRHDALCLPPPMQSCLVALVDSPSCCSMEQSEREAQRMCQKEVMCMPSWACLFYACDLTWQIGLQDSGLPRRQ